MVEEDKVEASEPVTAVELPAAEPTAVEQPLPTVTSAADWRRAARACFLVPLPTTRTVKALHPDWNRLILEGAIKQEQMVDITNTDEVGPERYQRILDIARRMAPFIVVEPVVVQSNGHAPEDDAEFISVDQIAERDLTTLLYWSVGARIIPGVRETTR